MKKIEQTLSSVEVAGMIGKQHKNLLADIRIYIAELVELKIQPITFFRESLYTDSNNRKKPCFDITKKGCEFVAHKLTGIKGTEFTARYINRFHDMEEELSSGAGESKEKSDRTQIMLMNARSRMAQTYLKMAQVDTLSQSYKSILIAKGAEALSGEQLLPLPKPERKVYSAAEIGERLGISKNKVGRIANENNLKTGEYGEYRRSKSEYSAKEVDTWVYYDSAIAELEKILCAEVVR